MNNNQDLRFRLLSDYLDELQDIAGRSRQSELKKIQYYHEICNSCMEWIDIWSDGECAGFLIIGRKPNCHPDADFYIAESYILPSYRRKGIMSKAVSEFVRLHSGIYCLLILKRNHYAKAFWKKLFNSLGYKYRYLRDVGATNETCEQYGFSAK